MTVTIFDAGDSFSGESKPSKVMDKIFDLVTLLFQMGRTGNEHFNTKMRYMRMDARKKAE